MSDSFVTPWTVAHQALLSVGFSRQGYWSGLPSPPGDHPYFVFFFFKKKTLFGLPLISFPFQCYYLINLNWKQLMIRFIRSMFGSFTFNFSFLFPPSLLIDNFFYFFPVCLFLQKPANIYVFLFLFSYTKCCILCFSFSNIF